jgi:hypothetical protein
MDPPGEISDDRPSEVTFNSSRFQPRFGSQLYARHAVDIFLASKDHDFKCCEHRNALAHICSIQYTNRKKD